MWINLLYFVAGCIFTASIILIWAVDLAKREQIRELKETIRVQEEERKFAQQQIQAAINEYAKQKRQPSSVSAAPVPNNPDESSSVKDRLKKAAEITTRQAKIDPRKGPDDLLQHNELELEKLSVLKTIIADGFDPVITIRYNTGDQEMRLSSYIESIKRGLA